MRDIELAKLAAEEARVLRDNDIELAKLTQQEELARLKSEHEKDKEIELARLHLEHEKLKMEQEIEHEKLKMEQEVELTRIDSQERQAKLDSDAKFASQLELGKLGAEKAVMREILSYHILRKVKIRWIATYLDLRSTRSPINWIGVYGPRI